MVDGPCRRACGGLPLPAEQSERPKLDRFEAPTDLTIAWDGDALVLSATAEELDVVVELEAELGERSAALAPLALTVGIERASVRPEWPRFDGAPGSAPVSVHGHVRVSDRFGEDRGVRGVPDRVLVPDLPGEGWPPEELALLLPEGVTVEAGTALASVDPELYATAEVGR